jgi:hypothetical protein
MSENERLKAAALNLRGVMADIEVIEKKLEELNDERKRLEREVLPDLFAEAGIKALQLADGSRITLSTLAEGSLPKEPDKRKEALEWLVANGFENLIECKVTGSWARGDRLKALQEYERLSGIGSAKTTFDEGINHMILGARIRDRVVAGLPTPLMTLGVAVFQRARFTKKTSGDTE